MYSNSTFLTPSTSNSCLCVFNNRLPRLARYLQAVFIVTNSFERLNKLETWTWNSRRRTRDWHLIVYLRHILLKWGRHLWPYYAKRCLTQFVNQCLNFRLLIKILLRWGWDRRKENSVSENEAMHGSHR